MPENGGDDLLYNVSRRLLQKLKPQKPLTVMVPDSTPKSHGTKYTFHTVQDTTAIEEYCKERRKLSPDLRIHKNPDPAKKFQFGCPPPVIIDKVVGLRNFIMASGEEKKKLMLRILREYPQFMVTARHNIGL